MVSVVEPALTDQGWRFGDYPGSDRDDLNGATYLHELYTRADPTFTGRATVPVLWDKRRGTIVSNESADILRMLNSGFGALADETVDLYPANLRDAIDALNARIYSSLNNGVYRTGFATTQVAYEEAFADVFAMLDELEQRFADGRDFLFGDGLTEADIRLFVTLVRFDPAYHGLFRANLRRLADYPRLSAYLERTLAVPGVRETVNLDHIKRGYYSIKALNPTGIVPTGPELAWAA
jgi:putative glutathione S-transferase